METFLKIIGAIVFAIILFLVINFFTAFLVSVTWNYIMPKIFIGIYKLGYWDAYVLTILTSILFKSSVSTTESE